MVSIYIGTTTISWTHFNISKLSDRPTKINNWQYYNFEDKKFHLNDLVNLILHLDTLLPIADLYILESPAVVQNTGSSGGPTANPIQINLNIQKSQILAMLSFLLANRKCKLSSIDKNNNNTDNDNSNNNNSKIELNENKQRVQQIYFMKSYIVSR